LVALLTLLAAMVLIWAMVSQKLDIQAKRLAEIESRACSCPPALLP
jgi:hypothetical protein